MKLSEPSTLSVITDKDELQRQIGEPFLWQSRTLEDFWRFEPGTMPLEPLTVASSKEVQQELKMTVGQVKSLPDLGKKWRRIRERSEGDDDKEVIALMLELKQEIETKVLTQDQRKRYSEICLQRLLLVDDISVLVHLLEIDELTKSEKKAWRAARINFDLGLDLLE